MPSNIKQVIIYRFLQNNQGTYGALWMDGLPLCSTYELPWRNNQRRTSCIPKGDYLADLIQSPKNGIVYELQKVKGRSGVQLHIGNCEPDTLGCILLGKGHGVVNKDGAMMTGVVDSVRAFKEFMMLLKGDKKIGVRIVAADPEIK